MQGWLLLLPAAVLLATFTHFPAVATLIDSFFSTPHGTRAARVHRPRQLPQHAGRPVFWRALENNLLYALITMPVSIALALGDGALGQRPDRRPAALRLAFFTPTMLPMVAAANIWLFFYTPGLRTARSDLRRVRLRRHNWLGSPATAFPA